VANLNAPSLFLIARDLKKMQVLANVAEKDIVRVAKGQSARFTVDAFPNDTFFGRVSQVRLAGTLVQNKVVYVVVIDVDNSDGKLKPYLSASVAIEVGERP